MTEWVRIKSTNALAIVIQGVDRGVKVRYPTSGQIAVFKRDLVLPFDPKEYPRQISSRERKKIKDAGKIPMDEIEMVCNKCFVVNPVENFAPNQTRKDGSIIRRPTCMNCREGIDGVQNHNERQDGSIPDEIPTGDWWQCPICEKSGIVNVTMKIVLDHDHLSGHARDYICDSCNTGLGRFRNGQDFLRNALNYIGKYENNN